MKFKIQLSQYGLVCERADIEIEAPNRKAAMNKALKQSEEGEIKFTNNQEATDGWEYQVEDCEPIKK